MKSFTVVAAILGLVTFGAGTARAASCSVDGNSYTCEAVCTGTGLCNIETSVGHAACDSINNPNGNADGFCMICGDGQNNNITGTVGRDIICGKGGNDNINGDPNGGPGADDLISGDAGTDTIQGRLGNDRILGGTGTDTIHGNAGHDTILGEEDDDTLYGDEDNDEVDGGDDIDVIYGGGGSNVLRGGDDADFLHSGPGLFVPGELGSILCGGGGDDALEALGTGTYCYDAGPDQTGTTWAVPDCVYNGPPASATIADKGTQINCVNPGGPPANSAFLNTQRSCNCQD